MNTVGPSYLAFLLPVFILEHFSAEAGMFDGAIDRTTCLGISYNGLLLSREQGGIHS